MRFVPKPLRETAEINADPAARRFELVKLMLWAAGALCLLAVVGGWAVDGFVSRIPPEREARWFRVIAVPGALDEEKELDSAQRARLSEARTLLERLRSQPDVVDLPYRLQIIRHEAPNALAFPGGVIALTTGLLREIDGGVPLAFVLGHELGHFAHRDHLRIFGRSAVTGVFLSVIGVDSGAGAAATAADLMQRGFSREQESEADRFSLGLVEALFADTAGAGQIFEKLEKSSGLPSWLLFTATHPDPEGRLRDLKAHATKRELPDRDRGGAAGSGESE